MSKREKYYKICKGCEKRFSFLAFQAEVSRSQYCTRDCANRCNANRNAFSKMGKKNPMFGKSPWNYRGGMHTNVSGSRKVRYREISLGGRYVSLHRVIMEAQIGRPLREDEVVHHVDGNGLNNKVSNLRLMKKSEHSRLHTKDLKRDSRNRFIKK